MLTRLDGCRAPRVYVANVARSHSQRDEVDVFVVRGTSSKRDVRVDVLFRMTDAKFRKRVQQVTANATDSIKREVAITMDLAISQGWHLHRGMFVHAAGVAAAISNAVTPGRSVRLYGHSLGGACVSMVYAWLRAARVSGDGKMKAAVMSSPDFCDAACRDAWLAQHDDPAYFRHYYTRGDPFVHRIPRMAGFKAGLSASPFVCPMPLLDKRSSLIVGLRPLLAHVVYSAKRFVAVSLSSSRSPSLRATVCCDSIDVLADPKYGHALRTTTGTSRSRRGHGYLG